MALDELLQPWDVPGYNLSSRSRCKRMRDGLEVLHHPAEVRPEDDAPTMYVAGDDRIEFRSLDLVIVERFTEPLSHVVVTVSGRGCDLVDRHRYVVLSKASNAMMFRVLSNHWYGVCRRWLFFTGDVSLQ